MAAMATRLLILEDDDGLRASLRLVLEDEGYDVVEASTAERALESVAEGELDLMLVDLMLGGMDGFSFIQRARPLTDAPIVVEEVKARLRALLRRPSISSTDEPRPGEVFVLDGSDGPLVFDRGAAVLARGDQEIHLTNTEFRLLSVLAENAGRVLSRSSLLEHVWERGFFGDERIVDVHVRRLRKKLEKKPSEPSTLVTVRGLGYRLDLR